MIGGIFVLLLCGFTPQGDPAQVAEQFYRDKRWADVVSVWRMSAQPSAPLDYYAGMSLARLSRLEEARQALEAGLRKDPHDKRFATELAGLAFERKDFSAAKSFLGRALALDPGDRYANDFLASIYFLEQNLDAALIYWNRIDKPHVEEIRMDPKPAVDPVLLDRAFAAAPASVLKLRDLRATEASLDLTGIFPRYQLALVPRDENENFDLMFRSTERNGWGATRTEGLGSMLRGAPFLTIYPEVYNLKRRAINMTSLVRFDPNKERFWASLGMPVGGDPGRRLEIFFDGRRENWDFARTFHGIDPPTDLRFQKFEGGAQIHSVVGDGWNWSSGLSLSDRRFDRFQTADRYFTDGLLLKYLAGAGHPLLRMPEKRLTVDASTAAEFGKLFAANFGAFSKISGAIGARWFPQPQGDKYELNTGIRSGRVFGPVPLDELYILGLERDNDLPLGAHIGTHGGKKGSAPLGRTYLLWNTEADRIVYAGGFFKVRLGPFLDSGKITDPSGIFGTDKWLWDAGARLQVRILAGVTLALSYGRDMRGGRNAIYLTAVH